MVKKYLITAGDRTFFKAFLVITIIPVSWRYSIVFN